MTELSPVFKLALGAAWTAGYRPTREEKFALQRACGYFDHAKMNAHLGEFVAGGKGSGFDGMRDYFQCEAIRALQASGYPLAEVPAGLDLVQPLALASDARDATGRRHNPRGEAVGRLQRVWIAGRARRSCARFHDSEPPRRLARRHGSRAAELCEHGQRRAVIVRAPRRALFDCDGRD
jgi:hypothetical protein